MSWAEMNPRTGEGPARTFHDHQVGSSGGFKLRIRRCSNQQFVWRFRRIAILGNGVWRQAPRGSMRRLRPLPQPSPAPLLIPRARLCRMRMCNLSAPKRRSAANSSQTAAADTPLRSYPLEATYTLTVKAKGFESYQQGGIVLNAGQSATQNVALTIGAGVDSVAGRHLRSLAIEHRQFQRGCRRICHPNKSSSYRLAPAMSMDLPH